MKITVTGLPGSGKSTIAKLLAEKLGLEHYSTGDFQRELAKEKGLSIKQLGEIEAKDDKIDLMVDNKTEEIAKSKENIVFDSWLAAHFVPEAIKIFLECDEEVRAKRRIPQKRDTEQYEVLDEAVKKMRERTECNQERWIRYYNYNFLDMTNYDFIINVAELNPEQIVAKILEFIEDFK